MNLAIIHNIMVRKYMIMYMGKTKRSGPKSGRTRSNRSLLGRMSRRIVKGFGRVTGKVMKMVKHNRKMKMWGGKSDEERNTTDLLKFYDRYLRQRVTRLNYRTVLHEGITVRSGDTQSLMVIDMQRDFIDEAFKGGRGPLGIGAFSVADGKKLERPLSDFISTNLNKFYKVIFSRDAHDPEHCSFYTQGPEGGKGPFPPHCEINSIGGAFPKSWSGLIEQIKDLKNVEVIFKGMDKTTDSFGAVKYPNDDYFKSRQLGSCCKTHDNPNTKGTCGDATGGSYLKNKTSGFDDHPFRGTDNKKYKDVKSLFGEDFKVEDIVPEGTGVHRIYIVGLAGDFCVKDTAINIAKYVKTNNGKIKEKDIQVIVIQPFARYVFLPITLRPTLVGTDGKLIASVLERKKGKDLINYVIKVDGDNKKILPPSGQDSIDSLKDKLFSDADHMYRHFVTDPEEILKAYKENDVKLLMSVPTFP
jgi:nicotinamidase-related amidase